MNRILIISYLFPPLGGIAVQRALSLAKYLPEHGYTVHVLTARNAAGPVFDPGLLARVPAGVQIHRAFTPEIPFAVRQKIWKWMGAPKAGAVVVKGEPRRVGLLTRVAQRILCPEPEVLWVPWAVRKAHQIVREHNIDVVLVTAPPFSAFLVGNAVKRRFPNVCLVSDFRDEWLTFYLNNNDFQNNPHARRKAPRIERETVRLSDLVVAVNESSLQEIRKRYPEQASKKFVCVPNGYAPEAFAGVMPTTRDRNRIVVAHGGTVYNNASPRFYLNALQNLPDAVRSQVDTWFIGRVVNEEEGVLRGRNVSIRRFDFMPQKEALAHLSAADYLLLTMTDPISIPGKIYEYLALRRPILAFAPRESEVDRIIAETGAGWRLDLDDAVGGARLLGEILTRKVRPAGISSTVYLRYNRKNLAAEYASHITRIRDTGQ